MAKQKKTNFYQNIVKELKQSPIATISGAIGVLISLLGFVLASQFQIEPINSPVNSNIKNSLPETGLHAGNTLLIISFFLAITFALAPVVRKIARKHNIAGFFVSIPLVALVNFLTILMIYLTPPRVLTKELFTYAHDLVLYASAVIFITFCGKAVMSSLMTAENKDDSDSTDKKTNEGGEGIGLIFIGLIVLFAWTKLIFIGQVLLTKTFLPEITHPIEIKKHKQNSDKLSAVALIERGMNQEEIIKNLGMPAKVELNTKAKVLHYCSTSTHDTFVTIVLKDDKVLAVRSYILTLDDTSGKTGNCTIFFKNIDLDSTIKNGNIVFKQK